jgi:flavorubredoxin
MCLLNSFAIHVLHQSLYLSRFAKTAGIGCIIKEKRSRIFRKYKDHTERESENSIQVAINSDSPSIHHLANMVTMTINRNVICLWNMQVLLM